MHLVPPSGRQTNQNSEYHSNPGPPSAITIVPVGLLAAAAGEQNKDSVLTDGLSELSLTEVHLAELVGGLNSRQSHLQTPTQLHCLSSDGLASPDTKFEWVYT